MTARPGGDAPITGVGATAFTVPTDAPEADGTMSWTETTLVLATVAAAGATGIGYTYADKSNVPLISDKLAGAIKGVDAFDIPFCLHQMRRHIRNLGRAGLAATAMSAVDAALWDLKAKLLGLPLAKLLGMQRQEVPVYGSGGFTSYSDRQLTEQLSAWVQRDGCQWVKMKVGSDPDRDPDRVEVARSAIGEAALFVDANGAYARKRAAYLAEVFAASGVIWFEEPVSSDDLEGLRLIRGRVPAPMEVAAGEYAYDLDYVRRMLAAGAVDVQQVDASRCCGISGFIEAGALCAAHHTDLSGHCAPALHLHAACAAPRFRHLEWFHDHVRIEHMLFDGAPTVQDGRIRPDLSRSGLGLELKASDAARYEV